MGSFRTAPARAHDQATLTAGDRPAWLPEVDEAGLPNWLGVGESITYWTRLPHGAVRRISSAASENIIDATGRIRGRYDVGVATLAQLREGIVDWTILDETGQRVAWDPDEAEALIDGLPVMVVTELGNRIGRDEPEPVSTETVVVVDGEKVPNA